MADLDNILCAILDAVYETIVDEIDDGTIQSLGDLEERFDAELHAEAENAAAALSADDAGAVMATVDSTRDDVNALLRELEELLADVTGYDAAA
jgi:hypothetical protein